MADTYNISKHCKTRYAERILNKEEPLEINRFVVENDEKIVTDINKMIEYGELIFQGKSSQKERKGNEVSVYLKDAWIVLVDPKSKNVITLYKVDLGCGDDFNNQYVSKMKEKLDESKKKLAAIQDEVNTENKTYRELIEDSQVQINEYKQMIKNLEGLCEGYKTIIDNNVVKTAQANKEIVDVVNTLISKKEF